MMATNISNQQMLRLIAERNSPAYSYGIGEITSENPNEIGSMVLEI